MVFLFNFFVLYFLNFISQITLVTLVEFWFGLLCSFFLKKNRNLSLYQNKIYMATNLNEPTNGLPLNRDVFTMFLNSYTSLVMWIWERENSRRSIDVWSFIIPNVLKKVEGLLVSLLLEFCIENLLL